MRTHQAIIDAVNKMKASEFGVAAIKVELEGQLNRRDDDSACSECDEGLIDCPECDQPWNATEDCGTCHGDGTITCRSCGGNWEGENHDFSSTEVCQDFFFERLKDLGLAKENDGSRDGVYRSHTPYDRFIEDGPLKYLEFYYDGSVDSECTFTILLDNPENVFYLVKMIEIWNELVEANGNGCTISGAGMHMALIKDPQGMYPSNATMTRDHTDRYHNFEKSMRLLIPALFFLGSTNENSRSLRFRSPQVSDYEKYSAVYYTGGALEYRVFETCYDNPETILDNMVVIGNTIRYWTSQFKAPGLDKVTTKCAFGNDSNSKLERFFFSETHIALLNRGLAILKPSYYTVGELKKQRGFTRTIKAAHTEKEKRRKEAEAEYAEYEERFNWRLEYCKSTWRSNLMSEKLSATPQGMFKETDKSKLLEEIESKVKEYLDQESKKKKDITAYVEDVVTKYINKQAGHWTLSA